MKQLRGIEQQANAMKVPGVRCSESRAVTAASKREVLVSKQVPASIR